ncbi:hypothetical protein EVAR_290_1 [Eumeta japonica]|uniref:Uncharacterized protein n=1 Tax=Eumeta variegata TaxID=151549 RepID=A0A4C1S9I9_EUMVA|nr:hypothetical protein EVAR_290_1 [Eumeta japonica]
MSKRELESARAHLSPAPDGLPRLRTSRLTVTHMTDVSFFDELNSLRFLRVGTKRQIAKEFVRCNAKTLCPRGCVIEIIDVVAAVVVLVEATILRIGLRVHLLITCINTLRLLMNGDGFRVERYICDALDGDLVDSKIFLHRCLTIKLDD